MRKRSKYRPKGINPQAHVACILGTFMMDKTDSLIRAQRVAMAVEDISRGNLDKAPLTTVFDAVNLVEEWIHVGVAADADGLISTTQRAVIDICTRKRDSGTTALRADELQTLRDFVSSFTELVSGVTNQEYYRAQRSVEERVRRIMSGERIPASPRIPIPPKESQPCTSETGC